ncbi:MAG: glycosyltransferase family 2 protein, partial [Planctomycetota bacterium]
KLVYPLPLHRIQSAGLGVSRSGRVQWRGRGQARGDPRFNRRRECQALPASCLAFPYALYEEIGGLDEAFDPMEYEDLDFCYRIRAHGYKALCAPSVELLHWGRLPSDGTEEGPDAYLLTRNGLLFRERWRHMFETEEGPAEEECQRRGIDLPALGAGEP